MWRTRAIRRVSALVLVAGLLLAPAAWAGQSRGTDREGSQSFSVLVGQWWQGLMSEVTGWFGVSTSKSTTDPSTTDPVWTDPFGPGTVTQDGGGANTTEACPEPDPNGTCGQSV